MWEVMGGDSIHIFTYCDTHTHIHTHTCIHRVRRERADAKTPTHPANRPIYVPTPGPLTLYKFSHDFSGFSRGCERTSRRQTHASRPPTCLYNITAPSPPGHVKKNRKSIFYIVIILLHTKGSLYCQIFYRKKRKMLKYANGNFKIY